MAFEGSHSLEAARAAALAAHSAAGLASSAGMRSAARLLRSSEALARAALAALLHNASGRNGDPKPHGRGASPLRGGGAAPGGHGASQRAPGASSASRPLRRRHKKKVTEMDVSSGPLSEVVSTGPLSEVVSAGPFSEVSTGPLSEVASSGSLSEVADIFVEAALCHSSRGLCLGWLGDVVGVFVVSCFPKTEFFVFCGLECSGGGQLLAFTATRSIWPFLSAREFKVMAGIAWSFCATE